MRIPDFLYSLELEKQFLSAVITCPEVLADCPFVTEKTFSPTNKCVFSAIKACLSANEILNQFTLISKLDGLNIKIAGELEPENYINSLVLLNVSSKAAIGIAKELGTLEVNREVWDTASKISEFTGQKTKQHKDGTFYSASDIVNEATKIFNQKINLLSSDEKQPVDLFGTIKNFVEKETIFDKKSIVPPFKYWKDFWGNLDPGNVTVIASRMKVGKTTLWLSMLYNLCLEDHDDSFRVLVLDTELTDEENQSRILSAVSGVKEYDIRHGHYRHDREKRKKVIDAAEQIAFLDKKVNHFYCGGMDLDDILSVCRRWGRKNLVEGKRGLIVWDYIKLNSAQDFSGKNQLFMTIGAKIDAMKNLTKELQVPCLCFCQTNRENVESKAGERIQNSSIIGGSDMIAQFASHILLLEKLTPEERVMLNQIELDSATHALKAIACRVLGPDDFGENRLVKYQDARGKDRFCENYLLYNFNSFKVTEIGTFNQIMEKNKITKVSIQDNQSQDQDDNQDDPNKITL